MLIKVKNVVHFPWEVEKGMCPENYSLYDHAPLTALSCSFFSSFHKRKALSLKAPKHASFLDPKEKQNHIHTGSMG
jgi:hypothetical protein